MMVFICDWCGRKFDGSQEVGIYTTRIKDLGLPSKAIDIITQSKHMCKACMEKADILMTKKTDVSETEDVEKTPEQVKPEASSPKMKPAAHPVSITASAQNTSETTDTEDKSDGETGRRIDVDKILALKAAGWSVKNIAGDMGLEPQKVSQALCYIKKRKPEKWKAAGLTL